MSDVYPKIQTLYKRDFRTKFKTIIEGQFSLPEFEYLANNVWEWSEKFDGMCVDVQYHHAFRGGFSFLSKSGGINFPDGLINILGCKFFDPGETVLSWFRDVFGTKSVELFFEGIGPGIRGGGKYCSYYRIILLDILIDGWWLERKNIEDIAASLGLQVTPIVGRGTLYEMVETVKKGFLSNIGRDLAEGIVARPLVGLKTRGGERAITKLKYKDFIRE